LKGKLNFDKYDLPSDIVLDNHKLYIFVHPLTTERWYRQPSATISRDWQAVVYLGGRGQHSAKEGERFEVVAFLTDVDLQREYNSIREITQGEGKVYRISEIITIITHR
jgi:hypothetical protein